MERLVQREGREGRREESMVPPVTPPTQSVLAGVPAGEPVLGGGVRQSSSLGCGNLPRVQRESACGRACVCVRALQPGKTEAHCVVQSGL